MELILELTGSLVTLTTTPVSFQDEKIHCFERFVVVPFDPTTARPYSEVNAVRKELFTKRNSVQIAQRIPPTYDVCLGSGLCRTASDSVTNKLGLMECSR